MARSAADTAEGLFVLASLLAITNSSWSTESITLRAVFVFVAVLNYRTPVDAALSCCAFRKASSSGLLLGCFSPVLLLGAITAAGAPSVAGAHFWSLLGCALQFPLASLMPRSSWHALILGAPPTWLIFALLGRILSPRCRNMRQDGAKLPQHSHFRSQNGSQIDQKIM